MNRLISNGKLQGLRRCCACHYVLWIPGIGNVGLVPEPAGRQIIEAPTRDGIAALQVRSRLVRSPASAFRRCSPNVAVLGKQLPPPHRRAVQQACLREEGAARRLLEAPALIHRSVVVLDNVLKGSLVALVLAAWVPLPASIRGSWCDAVLVRLKLFDLLCRWREWSRADWNSPAGQHDGMRGINAEVNGHQVWSHDELLLHSFDRATRQQASVLCNRTQFLQPHALPLVNDALN
mmetsp:Transcript_66755/g.191860  ORF Transcript_66755/g.191860 Transcript_66755/m.191860 type:complete len:235 (-) Transcript_66755:351-1055(-)